MPWNKKDAEAEAASNKELRWSRWEDVCVSLFFGITSRVFLHEALYIYSRFLAIKIDTISHQYVSPSITSPEGHCGGKRLGVASVYLNLRLTGRLGATVIKLGAVLLSIRSTLVPWLSTCGANCLPTTSKRKFLKDGP